MEVEIYVPEGSPEAIGALAQKLTSTMLDDLEHMGWPDAIYAAGIAVNAVAAAVLSVNPRLKGMSEADMRRSITTIFGSALLQKVVTKTVEGN